MTPLVRDPRPIVAALAALAVLAMALATTGRGPALAQDLDADGKPSELLAMQPFDRITLIDNSVFEIEPISPRPLPPNTPSKKAEPAKTKGDNVARPAEEKKAEGQPDADMVVIHLIEGDQRDFLVNRANIRNVVYWEDMLLAEGARLVQARNFAKAFEYYLAVQARNPNWRGLADHVDRLLFEEGSWSLASGTERDRAMRLLRELYDRRPDYEGLTPKLAEAYSGEIEQAVSTGSFAYGRRILHELREITPDSPLIVGLRNRFITRAGELADRAEQAMGGDRLDLLTRSMRIWPDQEGTPEKFAAAFREAPTLEVGVIDVPRPVAPWVRSPASHRITPLLYLPILRDESDEALLGQLPGQLLESLELGDLGRRLEIRLGRGLRWSDDSRKVSVIDAVRALSDRAQPRSPSYNARWADLLERIEASGDDTIIVRLSRSPISPTAWLLGPVGPAHAAWDGQVSTSSGRLPVGNGAFDFRSATDRDAPRHEILLEASGRVPQAVGSDSASRPISPFGVAPPPPPVPPKILRIREVQLADPTDLMVAFERGIVSMIELVPPDRVEALQADENIGVGEYRLPSLHRISVDGRNPALKSRLLRRGIAYAIDRKSILEEVVLRRPIDAVNRPSDGPFAAGSEADAPNVAPLEFNLLLAKMLIVGAKRELGVNRIRLRFEYPARPDVKLAMPRIIEALRNAGLEIDPVERSETELEQELRAGRQIDLAYRVSRVEEPVYEAGPLICPGYDAPPDSQGLAALASPRITQLLLQLEHAPEWPTALEVATQIDRECRDELPIIPLWQLQDHYAWRNHLTGPAEVADSLYENIERWEIEPWYARDPW